MEQFEVFTRDGKSLGLKDRDRVHRDGDWHKSAQVFLFDEQDRLLLQLRADKKDLYGGLWDYSCGEHLQPGESFSAGAERGLFEELGIKSANFLVPLQTLGAVEYMELAQDGYCDREIHQAFKAVVAASIELRLDPEEVEKVEWFELARLREWLSQKPEVFTPWFSEHVLHYGIV